MRPSRSPSIYRNCSPDIPQRQQHQDKISSSDLINSDHSANCGQCIHRTTNENYQHSNFHQQNYSWRYHQSRSFRSPVTPKKFNSFQNVYPLLGNVTMNDSSADIHAHPYPFTSDRTNKKRKQSDNEQPIAGHYDESSLLQQTSNDTNTQTKSTSTNIPSTKVTDEAKRYAESRYPFPPFILHFTRPKINDKAIIDELLNYCKISYSFDLELAGFRSSSIISNDNECNLLVFVKNSISFSFLYSDIKWPYKLGGDIFTIDRKPAVPPQLALIITNVSYKTNLNEFENDLKVRYENIAGVTRLKNKNHFDTKLVKVEFSLSKTRDDILIDGSIMVNYIKYDVKEFLPVATILICSNGMGLGHFSKQCKQSDSTCKVCGEHYQDLNKYCCGGDHNSNDMKCKVIKQYRADLTKVLLSAPSRTFNKYLNSWSDFPPLPQPIKTNFNKNNLPTGDASGIMSKLDLILNSMNNINNIIGDLKQRTEQIEVWLNDKRKTDSKTENDIKALQLSNIRHEGEVLQHAKLIEKMIFPVLDDMIILLMELNVKDGKILNVDFKSKSEI
ncbi:unnamed protein product [Rotaria sp. Silwood2]|nr:unnamed protein product [Rotaria sp. Silwood2]